MSLICQYSPLEGRMNWSDPSANMDTCPVFKHWMVSVSYFVFFYHETERKTWTKSLNLYIYILISPGIVNKYVNVQVQRFISCLSHISCAKQRTLFDLLVIVLLTYNAVFGAIIEGSLQIREVEYYHTWLFCSRLLDMLRLVPFFPIWKCSY